MELTVEEKDRLRSLFLSKTDFSRVERMVLKLEGQAVERLNRESYSETLNMNPRQFALYARGIASGARAHLLPRSPAYLPELPDRAFPQEKLIPVAGDAIGLLGIPLRITINNRYQTDQKGLVNAVIRMGTELISRAEPTISYGCNSWDRGITRKIDEPSHDLLIKYTQCLCGTDTLSVMQQALLPDGNPMVYSMFCATTAVERETTSDVIDACERFVKRIRGGKGGPTSRELALATRAFVLPAPAPARFRTQHLFLGPWVNSIHDLYENTVVYQ